MEGVFLLVATAVVTMASIFVFSQIRVLWHYAVEAAKNRQWTLAFWTGLGISLLLIVMIIFGLSMFDMLDGKFDIIFPHGTHGIEGEN